MTNPMFDTSTIASQQNVFALANETVGYKFGIGIIIALGIIAFLSSVERWGTKKALINGLFWSFAGAIFFILFQVATIATIFAVAIGLALVIFWPGD